MKGKFVSYMVIAVAIYLFSLYNLVQLSEKEFFRDYAANTTKINLYDHKTAYLFLNNETSATYFMQLKNGTSLETQLGDKEDLEIYHKATQSTSAANITMLLVLGLLMGGARRHFGIGGSIYTEDKISTRLEDVAGLELQKQEVFEFVDFLKNRDKYLAIGARMPRGALFHGPPGTGKTLLAKAVAGECHISFLSVAGPDFSEMFVGVGASRVRDLFSKARKKAPCIIFIDEIDALARARHNLPTMGHQEKENTLNRLLIELDGFNKNDKVLVFGATNRLDMLDKALLRPGRFDRKIQFELPERQERVKLFQHYLQKMELDDKSENLAVSLSKQSFGFSCADIANICNEASILAVRNDKTKVTRAFLEAAVDNVLLGHEKKTFQLSSKDKEIVAYHESGHTLVAFRMEHVRPPVKVSIVPRERGALGFSMSEVSERKLKSKEEITEQICVLLGGRIAEEVFCGGMTTGASDDIQKLTALAYQYVATFGMDTGISTFYYDRAAHHYSEKLRQEVDTAVHKLVTECYARTKRLVADNKDYIEKMARALIEKEILNQEEIEDLFKVK